MDSKRLVAMERWNVLFSVIFLAASALLFGFNVALGVGVGAAVSCINFWGLRKLVEASFRSRGKKRAVLMFLLMFKMGILMATLWLLASLLPITPVAIAVGFSVFLMSIAVESLRFVLRAQSTSAEASFNG